LTDDDIAIPITSRKEGEWLTEEAVWIAGPVLNAESVRTAEGE
jgi:hypothetical protein